MGLRPAGWLTPQVHAYLRRFVAEQGIQPHLRARTKLVAAEPLYASSPGVSPGGDAVRHKCDCVCVGCLTGRTRLRPCRPCRTSAPGASATPIPPPPPRHSLPAGCWALLLAGGLAAAAVEAPAAAPLQSPKGGGSGRSSSALTHAVSAKAVGGVVLGPLLQAAAAAPPAGVDGPAAPRDASPDRPVRDQQQQRPAQPGEGAAPAQAPSAAAGAAGGEAEAEAAAGEDGPTPMGWRLALQSLADGTSWQEVRDLQGAGPTGRVGWSGGGDGGLQHGRRLGRQRRSNERRKDQRQYRSLYIAACVGAVLLGCDEWVRQPSAPHTPTPTGGGRAHCVHRHLQHATQALLPRCAHTSPTVPARRATSPTPCLSQCKVFFAARRGLPPTHTARPSSKSPVELGICPRGAKPALPNPNPAPAAAGSIRMSPCCTCTCTPQAKRHATTHVRMLQARRSMWLAVGVCCTPRRWRG